MFKRILGGLRERKKARHDAFSKSPIRLILGIGNPGEQHQNTYHNAGLLYLDYLSGGCKNEFKQYRSFAFCKKGGLALVKSRVPMNRSGEAVRQAMKYFNLKSGEVLVAHDDSDIQLGNYKIVFDRGSAGHKGIESIITHLGNRAFWRLRIGIRKTGGKANDFVLSKMSSGDLATLRGLFSKVEIPNP